MPVDVDTDEITESYSGADKRCETASELAFIELNIVGFPGGERGALTYNRACLVGDLTSADCVLKQLV